MINFSLELLGRISVGIYLGMFAGVCGPCIFRQCLLERGQYRLKYFVDICILTQARNGY